jgi:hypothetical protein
MYLNTSEKPRGSMLHVTVFEVCHHILHQNLVPSINRYVYPGFGFDLLFKVTVKKVKKITKLVYFVKI